MLLFFERPDGRGRSTSKQFMSGSTEYSCDNCGASFDSKRKMRAHQIAESQRISREELRQEIQRLAETLNRAPKAKDMNEQGDYSAATYFRRYESWDSALVAANVDPKTQNQVPDEAIIDEIQRLADALGNPPTATEMSEQGEFSVTLAQNRFGSWNDALKTAGYRPHHQYSICDQELTDEIERLVTKVGRSPTIEDMREYGRFSIRPYLRRFNSWEAAVRQAGFEPIGYPSGPDNPLWKPETEGGRYYGSNWQIQRQRALARDNFTCQTPGCEVSNEEHRRRFGRSIEVHHVRPLRDFNCGTDIDYDRANAVENLVTVCAVHHSLWERMCPLKPDIRHQEG
jgi:hypothetical protein